MPIFWVHGFTDPLFPATEALQIYKKVRAVDPRYPVKLFLGDVGHDYSGERKDEWDLAARADERVPRPLPAPRPHPAAGRRST